MFTLSRKCIGITIYILHYHDITEITTHPDKAEGYKDKSAPAGESAGILRSLIYYVFEKPFSSLPFYQFFFSKKKNYDLLALKRVRAKKRRTIEIVS